MSHIELLRKQAAEIAAAGHNGWGNTMTGAASEIAQLRAALEYAQGGFALAYDAASKRLNDEVLMHCGHHEAACAKVLE